MRSISEEDKKELLRGLEEVEPAKSFRAIYVYVHRRTGAERRVSSPWSNWAWTLKERIRIPANDQE